MSKLVIIPSSIDSINSLVNKDIEGFILSIKNLSVNASFYITIDEGVVSETEEKGNYGPYIQTKRLDIYKTFAKYLVENERAK